MTTAVQPQAARRPRRAPRYHLSEVMSSEWTKLTTVRSYRYTLAAFAILTIAVSVIVAATTGSGWKAANYPNWDPTNTGLSGIAIGELLIGILGVLAVTSEFSSGSIRATLAAVPRRRTLVAAKAAVYGLTGLVVAEIVTVLTFFASQAFMGSAPHATFGQPGVARAVLMTGAYLPLLGLFGMGLGLIIRHTAGAVGAFAAIVIVLPPILTAVSDRVSSFAPELMAANSIGAVIRGPHAFNPWVDMGLMVLYALVALAVGTWVFCRKDV